MKFLIINGPNLNNLSQRDPAIYGTSSLQEIEERIAACAQELGVQVIFFQSNSEGAIIDFLQASAPGSDGIIINPAALTHYGISLREAIVDISLPCIEVHLSNIHARELWRRGSVIAPVTMGQISGLGWRGYLAALNFLAAHIKEERA